MRPCSSAALLALLLLVTASAAEAQAPTCQTGIRHIELSTAAAPPFELCISPGVATTILFDQALAQGAPVLEARERFQRVEATGSLVVLVPSEKLMPGERLRLTVRFKEAGPVEQASFVLVVHRDQAERQVEVSRPRAADSCQAQLQRQQEELRRCLDGRPSLPAQSSLASLLADKDLPVNSFSKVEISYQSSPELAAGAALAPKYVLLYSFRTRSVVEVKLKNKDLQRAWQVTGASLRGPSGEALELLGVGQAEPLQPGQTDSVWVELPRLLSPGSYTLELWDEDRQRTLTLKALKLP